LFLALTSPANGLRYLLAGGTRERHFDGTGWSQENCLKTRRIPASQVHAVLGGVFVFRLSVIPEQS